MHVLVCSLTLMWLLNAQAADQLQVASDVACYGARLDTLMFMCAPFQRLRPPGQRFEADRQRTGGTRGTARMVQSVQG